MIYQALLMIAFGIARGGKPTDEESDEYYLERYFQGDDDALVYLYRKYFDRFLHIVCNLINSEFLAEDVIQNTFMHMLVKEGRRPMDNRKVENAQAYLTTIIKRKSFDYAKSKHGNKIHKQVPIEDEKLATFFAKMAGNEWTHPVELFEEKFKEYIDAVVLLLKLKGNEAKVFHLKCDGWTNEEVAKEIGSTNGTVATTFHTVKKKAIAEKERINKLLLE